jgi:hypothetical protein
LIFSGVKVPLAGAVLTAVTSVFDLLAALLLFCPLVIAVPAIRHRAMAAKKQSACFYFCHIN